MPAGNEGQQSDADLDQKIAERSRAIALNQKDGKVYRDRGLLLARKREYDLAMSDLNKALLLNPNDAHAFGLRGLVWEKKNDSKRALADLEKAIQLDPTNAAIYRSHMENILRNGAHIGDDRGDPAATPHGLGGFFKRLAQYYAEFLSTDFKKQRLPRRRLQTSDAQGRLVGITTEQIIGISQGWKLNGAVKTTERKLGDGTLKHAGQPLMNWAVSNAKVEPRGNAILITKAASGTAKIDALMAAFNAISLLSTNPTAGGSVYTKDRGLLFI